MEKNNFRKHIFPSELAYVFGVLFIELSICIMTKCDLGLSMIISPAYILHVKLSEFIPFFTFGMASYTLQFFLILSLMIIVKRFRISFLFAFATSVICGLVLDLMNFLARDIVFDGLPLKIIMFFVAIFICAFGVACMFRTYLSPEAYDLFVKVLAEHLGKNITGVRTAYDITSCLVAVILSFLLFGFPTLVGVKLGTIVCALLNGPAIGAFGKLLDRFFDFKPILKKARKDSFD